MDNNSLSKTWTEIFSCKVCVCCDYMLYANMTSRVPKCLCLNDVSCIVSLCVKSWQILTDMRSIRPQCRSMRACRLVKIWPIFCLSINPPDDLDLWPIEVTRQWCRFSFSISMPSLKFVGLPSPKIWPIFHQNINWPDDPWPLRSLRTSVMRVFVLHQ